MKEWGIMVPIVTPCTRTGELDVNGLSNITNDMVTSGCHSLFVGSSTGRGPWLSREERVSICKKVVDQVGDKVPVVAGCISLGLDDMLENAFAMADAGAKAAVITAPVYFKYSQDELYKIFMNFADSSPLPVMLYDIPDFAGIKIEKNIIIQLSRHEKIIGFKDSTDDFIRFQELIKELDHRPDFYLLQGKERWLADSLKMGASGFVVSMIHIAPDLFVGLYKAVRSGNLLLADKIQIELSKVMDLVTQIFKKRYETSTLFHFINQCLILRGVCENIVLDQDGECPDWLVKTAAQANEICAEARLFLDH